MKQELGRFANLRDGALVEIKSGLPWTRVVLCVIGVGFMAYLGIQ